MTADDCRDRLHRAGWSLGEVCVMTDAGPVWLAAHAGQRETSAPGRGVAFVSPVLVLGVGVGYKGVAQGRGAVIRGRPTGGPDYADRPRSL